MLQAYRALVPREWRDVADGYNNHRMVANSIHLICLRRGRCLFPDIPQQLRLTKRVCDQIVHVADGLNRAPIGRET